MGAELICNGCGTPWPVNDYEANDEIDRCPVCARKGGR